MFRGDYTQEHYWKGMTPAQLIGIGICAAGILLLWIQWHKAPPADTAGKTAAPHKA
jgi:hypothetical protein